MNDINLVNSILAAAIAGLWWFIKDKLKAMQTAIDENRREIDEIKENYLDRFQDLRNVMIDGHGDIKDVIADLREDLAKNYLTKAEGEKLTVNIKR